MRKVALILLSIGVASACSVARAAESSFSPEEQALLNKIMNDSKKRQAVLSVLQQSRPTNTALATRSPARTDVSAALDTQKNIPINNELKKNNSVVKQYSQCPGWVPLLRQDWKDIGIIAGQQCPDPVDKATGAQLSFADDRIAKNQIFTMHGTAALIYNSITGNTPGQTAPYETSAGAYVTVNRLGNTSAALAKSNTDTVAYGGVGEIGFATSTGANYFQVRGGGVQDNLKSTTAADVSLEWLPVYYPLHIHEPFQPFGLPVIIRFDPSLIAQYDNATGKGQVLSFNNRSEALRLGPELSLKLIALPGGPEFLTRFNALVTYRWAYEAYTGARLDWFKGSVGYNLDQAGYISLNGTYKRGRDETTGALTNIYTIGLNGKI